MSNTIVSNCHKIPQKEFDKKLLSETQIAASLQNSIQTIKRLNATATIIFTVSPVRHLKDGFIENSRSKAHLITAIHQVVSKNNLYYFPSYELMMDELREYRFYKEDLIHPNATAIEYIWNFFKEHWIDNSTKKTMTIVKTIQKGLAHRPFNERSEEHQRFKKQLEVRIKELQLTFPSIRF